MSKAPTRPPAESRDVGQRTFGHSVDFLKVCDHSLKCSMRRKSCCIPPGGREPTNGCDVAIDFINLRFGLLRWKKSKIALEALVCDGCSNEGRVW